VSRCPLAIKEYYITNLSIRANTLPKQKIQGEGEIQAKAFSARNKDNDKLWRVALNVSCAPAEGKFYPYFIEVEAVGFFEVEDDITSDKAEIIVSNWGPTLLYGAIRELVMLITSRGPNPRVVLPSFSFTKENATPLDAQPSVVFKGRIPSDLIAQG
jgi:preprotein translocase subunit SecB